MPVAICGALFRSNYWRKQRRQWCSMETRV